VNGPDHYTGCECHPKPVWPYVSTPLGVLRHASTCEDDPAFYDSGCRACRDSLISPDIDTANPYTELKELVREVGESEEATPDPGPYYPCCKPQGHGDDCDTTGGVKADPVYRPGHSADDRCYDKKHDCLVGEQDRPRITDEAWELVNGDRQAAYGHPASDFQAMGRITGAIIGRWLESEGMHVANAEFPYVTSNYFPDIPPRIVALIQQAVKVSRESANPKRDNRVDGIGYWLCADRIVEDY